MDQVRKGLAAQSLGVPIDVFDALPDAERLKAVDAVIDELQPSYAEPAPHQMTPEFAAAVQQVMGGAAGGERQPQDDSLRPLARPDNSSRPKENDTIVERAKASVRARRAARAKVTVEAVASDLGYSRRGFYKALKGRSWEDIKRCQDA